MFPCTPTHVPKNGAGGFFDAFVLRLAPHGMWEFLKKLNSDTQMVFLWDAGDEPPQSPQDASPLSWGREEQARMRRQLGLILKIGLFSRKQT